MTTLKSQSLLLFLISAFSLCLCSGQKEIRNDVYMYGTPPALKGEKIAIKFIDINNYAQIKGLKYFQKKLDANFVAFNEIFIPGRTYTEEEAIAKLNEMGISHLISVTIKDLTTVGVSSAEYTKETLTFSDFISGGKSRTAGLSSELLSMLTLRATIFELNDSSLNEPSAVIDARYDVSGIKGVGASAAGRDNTEIITKRTIKKLVKGMKSTKAF